MDLNIGLTSLETHCMQRDQILLSNNCIFYIGAINHYRCVMDTHKTDELKLSIGRITTYSYTCIYLHKLTTVN